ncbi:MAG: hypothetical protein J6039_06070 [Alphaproteobacteria bacterium]|nr:hypothetical protein [Alphaproteobacteria bacterium]
MVLTSATVERVLEVIGIGWSLFTLVVFILIAISSFFIKDGKFDVGFDDEEDENKEK